MGICMTASIYNSQRLATAYAFHRPPVHRGIIAALSKNIQFAHRPVRALDIGCGAGLSTAALEPLADFVVGLEPAEAMLAHRRSVAANASFVVGQAEQLPFAEQSFDLMTAAGALNYADLNRFLPEAARVLKPDGVLVIYDFSAGRRLRGDQRLERWFVEFKRRWVSPPGYALDVQRLSYQNYGLRLTAYEEFEVAVPMTLSSYLLYAMSETSVEQAIARGESEDSIREWCRATLAEIFDDNQQEVLFDAYVACVVVATITMTAT